MVVISWGRVEDEKEHDLWEDEGFLNLTLRAIHHLKSPEEIEIRRRPWPKIAISSNETYIFSPRPASSKRHVLEG